jgi:intracellular sulfur oxidation DsrE/DsrF family protein
MTTAISIIETAYRATLEEQDDTILWLTHMLRNNGLDMAVLLRANAVNYAVRGQDARGLSFGGIELHHPPAIDRDVRDLLAKGVPVHVVREDLDERGINEQDLVDGVKGVSRRELPGILGGFDHVWHW